MQEQLVITKNILEKANMSAAQLALEIAVYLYSKRKLTFGQAKTLAGLGHLAFQKELAERNVYIHYDEEDYEEDLKNLGLL